MVDLAFKMNKIKTKYNVLAQTLQKQMIDHCLEILSNFKDKYGFPYPLLADEDKS